MRSNPFVTALIAITSILALIALIAWFVTLSGGSGAIVAAVIVGLSLPGAFLALLTTLLASALMWKPSSTTAAPVAH
jgi:hypothetical protein